MPPSQWSLLSLSLMMIPSCHCSHPVPSPLMNNQWVSLNGGIKRCIFHLLMWSKCLFSGFTMARVASFPTLAGLWCVLSNRANPPTTCLIYVVMLRSFSYIHERIQGRIRYNEVRNRKMGRIGVKRRRWVVRMRHEISASFPAWIRVTNSSLPFTLFLQCRQQVNDPAAAIRHSTFNRSWSRIRAWVTTTRFTRE